MRRLLFLVFLLLAAHAGRAQTDRPGRFPNQPGYPSQSVAPGQLQPTPWVTMAPTIPMGSSPTDGLLAVEPDSAHRRQYARLRVRAVLKVRLNKEGNPQDTLDYQAFDPQGRLTQAGFHPARLRRQLTYNAQGQCTAQLSYPDAAHAYTVISTYNPALRRGRQEVLLGNGQRTVVTERQLYQSADTLLTEVMAHPLTLGHTVYPEYYQRSLRRLLHPDTVLTLTSFYNARQEPTGTRADYSFYHRGRLLESGRLSLPGPRPAPGLSAPPPPDYARVLASLRHGASRHPQLRRTYDARQRLLQQETMHDVSLGNRMVESSTVVRYTYNALNQLIGAEMTVSSIHAPERAAYVVYSYLPNGLLLGETTDARTSKAVFYRYLYQYYE